MNDKNKHGDTAENATALPMPATAFLQWGVDEVAYVRPMVNDGQIVFAIHRADGQRLGIAASGNLALAAIIQNDLEPVALH
jgi:hypothetical protein